MPQDRGSAEGASVAGWIGRWLQRTLTAELTKRFRAEIKLARKVSHPNVCRIHEYGKEGHLAYIVMEFVDGVDLKRVMKEKGPLAADEAYDVAIEVAEALQAIHDVGIVHRDLKTPNIMRDAHGVVKLMDFGIAKRIDGETTSGMTATGQIVGTPEYMSPEQARAQRVDARSDIYSLGIVVFELFAGDVPFRGDTPLATLFKHVQEPPPLEGAAAARIPLSLRPLLRKALAKNKEERFASAREVAAALRRTRASSPAVRRAPEVPTPTTALPQLELLEEEATPVPTAVPTEVPTTTLANQAGRPAKGAGPAAPVARVPHPGRILPPSSSRSGPRREAPPQRAGRSVSWIVALAITGIGIGFLYLRRISETPLVVPVPVDATPSGSPLPTTALSIPVVAAEERAPASPSPTPTPATMATSEPERPRMKTGPGVRTAERGARTPAVSAQPASTPAAILATHEPSPTPAPSVAQPVPSSTAAATAVAPAPGPSRAPTVPLTPAPDVDEAPARVQVGVKPWGEVTLDDKPLGITPIATLSVAAGIHTLRFVHPDYQPILRKITVRPGETIRLQVDFALVGVPK